ncbi:MAG TPA: FAD-dependent oxidoreductase, partial [Thermosynechococcaceae cyanobacterium]
KTVLVSEFPWLGGMLTSAGVSAPDGNELMPLQTGIWGAFLRELQQRQPGGLDHAWVSFFTYDPRIGAEIFADWVAELPNLQWIAGQVPQEVLKQDDRITGVRFSEVTVRAKITLDGTELGDLLALGDVPHRWGWEWQTELGEASAPISPNALTQRYPVQVPTWVVVMQDFGEGTIAPEIPAPEDDHPAQFEAAWEKYGADRFLNYGRLPGNRLMINWPHHGNDYGAGVQRLVESVPDRQAFLQEAHWHSQSFARFIQTQLGQRYGLAEVFPYDPHSLGGGAFALHPYYRESRRLQGISTLREQSILPIAGGCVASLPVQVLTEGCVYAENLCEAIAIGNYVNDHHYPVGKLDLKPKAMRWGGRWTGTPFTIPYRCLVPCSTEGLLVCEKNISVSHIANGATRLQPVVLGIGQAAGMAAALCVEQNCQPRALDVQSLQEALLTDTIAPAAVIPLLNLSPKHPEWLTWQRYYLKHPEAYPSAGEAPLAFDSSPHQSLSKAAVEQTGAFERQETEFWLRPTLPDGEPIALISLVTLHPEIDRQLKALPQGIKVVVTGQLNPSGEWLLVDKIDQRGNQVEG